MDGEGPYDEIDKKYEEMENAQEEYNRILEENNYRELKISCCLTCKKMYQSTIEDVLECLVAQQDGWSFGAITELGLCDKYEANDPIPKPSTSSAPNSDESLDIATSKGHRSSAGFEHDFQKFVVEHWGEKLYYVEKEAVGETSGGTLRPDVVLRLKKPNPKRHNPVYVEVQRDIYKNNWLQRKMKEYEGLCLIVIRVENFEKLRRMRAKRLIAKLLETDTKKDKKKKAGETYKVPCRFCETEYSIHSIKGHEYHCKLNPKNKKKKEEL